MAKCLIVPEVTSEGGLRKISFELASAAESIGGDVAAVLIGQGARELAGSLSTLGANRVYVLDSPGLDMSSTSTFAGLIADVIKREECDFVLFGFTTFGRDLSARLAAKLDVGLLDDVTGIEIDDGGRAVVTKPLYAGKVISKCRLCDSCSPQLLSIRPNIFPAKEAGEEESGGDVVELSLGEPDTRSRVKNLRPKESGAVELKEAEIIISGGRAVKGSEGFEPIRRIAKRFGWALGSSRAAVDAGWIEHSYQVGQTGKNVNPKLYIACGISGAIQHLAGMQTSEVIVAINTDPEAPIFQIADYGIVGDIFTILPLLEEELAKVLE